jgi:hypothetical protein
MGSKWTLGRLVGGWSGLTWLRIWIAGGLLWVRWWTLGFWPTELVKITWELREFCTFLFFSLQKQ